MTLLEVRLRDARSFVELTYHREENITKTRPGLQDEMDNLENDFVDGILFSPDKGLVMVGRLTDTPSLNILSGYPSVLYLVTGSSAKAASPAQATADWLRSVAEYSIAHVLVPYSYEMARSTALGGG